jgi:hypothetical protein
MRPDNHWHRPARRYLRQKLHALGLKFRWASTDTRGARPTRHHSQLALQLQQLPAQRLHLTLAKHRLLSQLELQLAHACSSGCPRLRCLDQRRGAAVLGLVDHQSQLLCRRHVRARCRHQKRQQVARATRQGVRRTEGQGALTGGCGDGGCGCQCGGVSLALTV